MKIMPKDSVSKLGLTSLAHTLPYTYAQMNSLNVSLNDCIRGVFTYNRWESVRFLRMSFGYRTVTEIFHKRTAHFLQQIPLTQNNVLQFLVSLLAPR